MNQSTDIRLSKSKEMAEALEAARDFEGAAEWLLDAATILFEELENPSEARRCLVKALGISPLNMGVKAKLQAYFPEADNSGLDWIRFSGVLRCVSQ